MISGSPWSNYQPSNPQDEKNGDSCRSETAFANDFSGFASVVQRRPFVTKWVTRRDVDGKIVSQPEFCLEKNQVARATGIKTIDEHVASLLETHEIVEGQYALRKIHARGQVVGFIELSDERPPD
jgi:hypothetical protein